MTAQPYRYAIYWTPASDTALAEFGRNWLRRDVLSRETPSPLVLDSLRHVDVASITAAPRKYGFHATLKAPFRLDPAFNEDDLLKGVRTIAGAHRSFFLAGLSVRLIGSFIALVPTLPCDALNDLACACVMELDPFRSPMTDAERAKRNPDRLSPREREHLMRWGYPYVLDTFRFHMTLTDKLPPDLHAPVMAALSHAAAPFTAPQQIADIAVFIEPTPGAPFEVLARFPLGQI